MEVYVVVYVKEKNGLWHNYWGEEIKSTTTITQLLAILKKLVATIKEALVKRSL